MVSSRGRSSAPARFRRSIRSSLPPSLRSGDRARSSLLGPASDTILRPYESREFINGLAGRSPSKPSGFGLNLRLSRRPSLPRPELLSGTLREGYRKLILKTPGNMLVALGGSNQRGDTGTGLVRGDGRVLARIPSESIRGHRGAGDPNANSVIRKKGKRARVPN